MELEDRLLMELAQVGSDENITLIWQFSLPAESLESQSVDRDVIRRTFEPLIASAVKFLKSRAAVELHLLPDSGTLIVTARRKYWDHVLEEAALHEWSKNLSVFINDMMEAHFPHPDGFD